MNIFKKTLNESLFQRISNRISSQYELLIQRERKYNNRR